MLLISLLSIVLGVLIFILGLWIEIAFIMFIGACTIAFGIILIVTVTQSYNKSEEETSQIFDNILDDYEEGMTRGLRYTLFKRTINDAINHDIQDDVSGGINRSSRY